MRLLDRYIAKTVLSSIALVTLMLAGLQLFILFVNQLGDLGKAGYGVLPAMIFVIEEMPYEVYLFFPMASLLGCLIGLGQMASHGELIVMRASGMSIADITLAVFRAAIVVIVLVTLIGEGALPALVHHARDKKIQALSDEQALRTAHGIWLRYQNDFVSIGSIQDDNHLVDVHQFHFDAHHQLECARSIESIERRQGRWLAHGVVETWMHETSTSVTKTSDMVWHVSLKPSLLRVSVHEPDEMTLLELHRYLRAKQISRQGAKNYRLVYWQRLVQPLTTIVMMLLAIPFIFGPLRSSTMGSKLLTGATVGFGFYIINRFFGSASQVYQWPSIVGAVGPTCLCAGLGMYLMVARR
jgi:lipopolysaccharide export system permease protein